MTKPGFNVFMTAVLLAGVLSACGHSENAGKAASTAGLSESEPGTGESQSPPVQSASASNSSASAIDPAAEPVMESADKPASAPPEVTITAPAADSAPDPAAAAFKKGIFADVQALEDPLVNQHIKDLLYPMMKAFVDQDKKALAELFPDGQSADYYDYLFADSPAYRFDQAGDGVIEKDSEGRVSLPVSGKVLRGGKVDEFSWYVYFKKNDQGDWHLIAID